jgi:hypothetical protein
MKKIIVGVLAAMLTVGLFLAVAGRVGKGETVYTVPQVLASQKALRGKTILVRGTLGWPGHGPACRAPCKNITGLLSDPIHNGLTTYTLHIYVLEGPQDPILATLRQFHLLPPFPAITNVQRVYRVQIPTHAPAYCIKSPVCPSGVVLDTLR